MATQKISKRQKRSKLKALIDAIEKLKAIVPVPPADDRVTVPRASLQSVFRAADGLAKELGRLEQFTALEAMLKVLADNGPAKGHLVDTKRPNDQGPAKGFLARVSHAARPMGNAPAAKRPAARKKTPRIA